MNIKTLSDLRNSFWDYLKEVSPSLAHLRRSSKKQNQYPTDIRMSWVDYIDNMQKDGNITKKLAQRATL